VCTFHGAVRVGGHLCFVMDRYVGSVQAEMRQNGGRLTLEQILRCGIASELEYLVALSSLFLLQVLPLLAALLEMAVLQIWMTLQHHVVYTHVQMSF